MTSHYLLTLSWRLLAIPAWSLALWRQWPHIAATPAGAWVAEALALPVSDRKEH